MGKSNIAWTDNVWNPVTGCTEVSPGCAHCYAKTFAERFRGVAGNYFEHGFDVQLRPAKLEEPLRWKKPRRIFVNSMSDLFHEAIPDDYIDRVFAVMALTPQHTYQVLTKRPERMREYLTGGYESRVRAFADDVFPLPNVWLGVTAENQHFADERIPILLDTPAAMRFISVEPMLGPVDLTRVDTHELWEGVPLKASVLKPAGILSREALSWVIVGGESGAHRRPFDLQWARDVVAQCDAAGVPVFVKQGSAHKPGEPTGDAALDARKAFPGV